MFCGAAPENDDAMYHLVKLRERLGWKTEIPRHAPGCKAAMDKLRNIPDNEKVGEGKFYVYKCDVIWEYPAHGEANSVFLDQPFPYFYIHRLFSAGAHV